MLKKRKTLETFNVFKVSLTYICPLYERKDSRKGD